MRWAFGGSVSGSASPGGHRRRCRGHDDVAQRRLDVAVLAVLDAPAGRAAWRGAASAGR